MTGAPQVLWRDREEAGRALAERLLDWRGVPGALVVGLPRGGVVVGAAVAERLQLPLVPWAVRKLAHPAEPEIALGAIAPGGVQLWDDPGLAGLRLTPVQRRRLLADESEELQRRRRLYGDPEPAELLNRPLLVVDDGVATGLTVRAALASLGQAHPARLVLAVPVIDRLVAERLLPLVDGLVALATVDGLRSVGSWYRRFEPVNDDQVLARLRGDVRPR